MSGISAVDILLPSLITAFIVLGAVGFVVGLLDALFWSGRHFPLAIGGLALIGIASFFIPLI